MSRELDLDALLDPMVRVRELEDALRCMRDAYLAEHNGCAPIAQQTPVLRLRRQAFAKTLNLVGKAGWNMVKDGEPPQFERLRTEIERDRRDDYKTRPANSGDDDE